MSAIGSSPAATAAMDGIYRYQRHIYDLTRRPYLFGRDQMLARLRPPVGGTVLEVGCGTARNLLLAAKRYPNAEYFGLDVSEEMLKTAKVSIDSSVFRGLITTKLADATNFDARQLFGVQAFDRIFISYALSMIPAWEMVVDNALTQLRPGGELHIVDFGRMQGLPSPAFRAMRAWLNAFHVNPRDNLQHRVSEIAAAHGFVADWTEGRAGYSARMILRRQDH